MNKLGIIATALLFMAGYTASAQTGHDHNNKQDQKKGMMMQNSGIMQGGGMMQGMMGEGMCSMCGMMMNQKMPMKKYMMMVNNLPNMQQQLSLSDDQVNNMIDLQTDFKKQEVEYQAELSKKQMKMEKMLNNMPSAEELKKQMQQCADTKINMKVAAFETVKKMKDLLTEEQKETLRNMMMNQGGMMNK